MPKITTQFDVHSMQNRYFCTSRAKEKGVYYGIPADTLIDGEWDYPVKITIFGPHDVVEKTRTLPVRDRLHSTLQEPKTAQVQPDEHLEMAYEMAMSGE